MKAPQEFRSYNRSDPEVKKLQEKGVWGKAKERYVAEARCWETYYSLGEFDRLFLDPIAKGLLRFMSNPQYPHITFSTQEETKKLNGRKTSYYIKDLAISNSHKPRDFGAASDVFREVAAGVMYRYVVGDKECVVAKTRLIDDRISGLKVASRTLDSYSSLRDLNWIDSLPEVVQGKIMVNCQGANVELRGFVAALVAAKFFGDIDAFGWGNNIGIIQDIKRDSDGFEFVRAAKIDPGEAFLFIDDSNKANTFIEGSMSRSLQGNKFYPVIPLEYIDDKGLDSKPVFKAVLNKIAIAQIYPDCDPRDLLFGGMRYREISDSSSLYIEFSKTISEIVNTPKDIFADLLRYLPDKISDHSMQEYKERLVNILEQRQIILLHLYAKEVAFAGLYKQFMERSVLDPATHFDFEEMKKESEELAESLLLQATKLPEQPDALAEKSLDDQLCIVRNNLLSRAAGAGRVDVVQALLEQGADANSNQQDVPPLMAAILESRDEIVEMLLHRGANPNIICKRSITDGNNEIVHEEMTPLIAAIRGGNCAIVEMLLKQSAKQNVICNGSILKRHAEVRVQNSALWEALHSSSSMKMVELLLFYGTDYKQTILRYDNITDKFENVSVSESDKFLRVAAQSPYIESRIKHDKHMQQQCQVTHIPSVEQFVPQDERQNYTAVPYTAQGFGQSVASRTVVRQDHVAAPCLAQANYQQQHSIPIGQVQRAPLPEQGELKRDYVEVPRPYMQQQYSVPIQVQRIPSPEQFVGLRQDHGAVPYYPVQAHYQQQYNGRSSAPLPVDPLHVPVSSQSDRGIFREKANSEELRWTIDAAAQLTRRAHYSRRGPSPAQNYHQSGRNVLRVEPQVRLGWTAVALPSAPNVITANRQVFLPQQTIPRVLNYRGEPQYHQSSVASPSGQVVPSNMVRRGAHGSWQEMLQQQRSDARARRQEMLQQQPDAGTGWQGRVVNVRNAGRSRGQVIEC